MVRGSVHHISWFSSRHKALRAGTCKAEIVIAILNVATHSLEVTLMTTDGTACVITGQGSFATDRPANDNSPLVYGYLHNLTCQNTKH